MNLIGKFVLTDEEFEESSTEDLCALAHYSTCKTCREVDVAWGEDICKFCGDKFLARQSVKK